jgi:dUTPase
MRFAFLLSELFNGCKSLYTIIKNKTRLIIDMKLLCMDVVTMEGRNFPIKSSKRILQLRIAKKVMVTFDCVRFLPL